MHLEKLDRAWARLADVGRYRVDGDDRVPVRPDAALDHGVLVLRAPTHKGRNTALGRGHGIRCVASRLPAKPKVLEHPVDLLVEHFRAEDLHQPVLVAVERTLAVDAPAI